MGLMSDQSQLDHSWPDLAAAEEHLVKVLATAENLSHLIAATGDGSARFVLEV